MTLLTPELAAALLGPYFEALEGEGVAALHLDADARLLAITFSPPGDADGVDLPVGAILASSLRIGAVGIVVAHNHPSGDPGPSEEDRRATGRLAQAAAEVGLRLVDHVVFGREGYESFRELGLL
jgi:DNA repair protein RadC